LSLAHFPLPVFSQPVGVARYNYSDAITYMYIVSSEVANIFKYF